MKDEQHQNMLSDEQVFLLFQEVKRELNITESKKIAKIIGRVFSAIRKSMPARKFQSLAGKIPGLLQLQLVKDWHQNEKPVAIAHLDELVETIYGEENDSSTPLFHSELEVLNAVVLILQKLDKMTGLLNADGFKFSLVQEIRQVPVEHAA